MGTGEREREREGERERERGRESDVQVVMLNLLTRYARTQLAAPPGADEAKEELSKKEREIGELR